MKPTLAALGRAAAVLLGATLCAIAGAQQMPNKLDYDSTPAYQERNVTPPASGALNTKPGKVSSGKGPAPDRPNGLGMDAGAGSMGKKP